MAFALVGTIGTAVQSTVGASASPTFGASETRAAGNLLILFSSVTGTATLPGTPAGWTIAIQKAGTSCSATIYYKIAAGSDAAPTISGVTSGLIAAQLAEYSGNSGTPLDQSGSAATTSSPCTATFGGASKATTDLFLAATGDFRSVARTPTDTITSNHATVTQAGNNNGVSSVNHYSFGYATSTSSISGADTAILTPSVTTSITGLVTVGATFKVPGANATSTGTGTLNFVGAIPRTIRAIKTAILSIVSDFIYPWRQTATLSFNPAVASIGTQTDTDNFNRANQSPLAGNWTSTNIGPGSTLQITSNVVDSALPNSGADQESFWNTWSHGDDQYSQAAITVTGTTSTTGFGVFVRHATSVSTKTMYRCVINSAGAIDLAWFNAGAYTQIATRSVTYSAGTLLGLSIQGTTLKIWYGGVQQGASITDSNIASGSPGICLSTSVTSGNIDNWDAGTTPGSGGGVSLTKQTLKALSGVLSLLSAFKYPWRQGSTLNLRGAFVYPWRQGGALSFAGSVLKKSVRSAFSGTLSLNPLSLDDSYSETNQDSVSSLSGSGNGIGQAFTSNGGIITSAKFNLSAAGAVTGTIVADLYAITGSYGTTAVGTGSPLATSDSVDVSILTTSPTLITFRFSGANLYLMTAGVHYVILCRIVSTSGSIRVGIDVSSPSHFGNWSVLNSGSWTPDSGRDACFYIYTGVESLFKRTSKVLTAVLSFIGTIANRAGKLLSGVLSFIGLITKRSSRILRSTLSFVGSVTKRILKSVQSVLRFIFNNELLFPPSNMVAFWSMNLIDEGTQSTPDSSGNSNTLFNIDVSRGEVGWVGAYPRTRPGGFGGAVSFDSAGQIADSGINNNLSTLGGSFSFWFWIMRPGTDTLANAQTTSPQVLAVLTNTNGTEFSLVLNSDGTISFGNGSDTIQSVLSIPIDYTWHLITAWYDSGGGTWNLRINNHAISSVSGSAPVSGTDTELIFSTSTIGFQVSFVGLIDAVGYRLAVPTSADFSQIWNDGAGTEYDSVNGLPYIYYPLKRTNKILSAVLSFIGNFITNYIPGSQLFFKTLTATLSFVGSINDFIFKRASGAVSFVGVSIKQTRTTKSGILSFVGAISNTIRKAISGTVSFIGTLTRSINHLITATVSFIGSLTKRISHTISGVLSFVGSFTSRVTFIRLLTATLSFAGSFTKIIGKLLSGILSFIGQQSRACVKNVSATLSFIGSLTKRTIRTLSAVLSFVGSLTTGSVILKLMTGTLSFVGTITRIITHPLTATLSFIGSIVKSTSKVLTASVSFIGVLIHSIRTTFLATLSFIGSLTNRINTLKTATLSFVGSITKQTSRTLSASLPFIGTMTKIPAKALSGAISFAGALTRRISYHLNSVLSFIGDLSRAAAGHFFQSLSATLDFSGTLSRRIGYHLSSTLSFIGTCLKQIPKSVAATVSFIGSLTTRNVLGRLLTSALSFSGAVTKRTYKTLLAVLSLLGTSIKNIPVALAGILSSSGMLVRMTERTVSGSLQFLGQVSLFLGKMLTASIGFVGSLTKSIQRLLSGVVSFIGDLATFIPSAFMITLESTLNFTSFLAVRIPVIIKIAVDSVVQTIKIGIDSTTQTIKIAVDSSIQTIKAAVGSTTQTIKIVIKAIVDSFNINP